MREINKIRLAISYYCELHCRHCYVPKDLREKYDEIMSNQLEVEQIIKFLTTLKDDYGLQKVDITGGEALLTKVWPRTREVVDFALSNGLEVQINTTGSGNITAEEICEVVRDRKDLFLLHVSLDGVDESYVDAFRGKKGAMKASVAFMKSAIAAGLNVRTRYTVTNENIANTAECYQFVSDLGVKCFMCKPVNIAGNSIANNLQCLTPEQVGKLQTDLIEQSIGNKTRLDLPAPLYINEDRIPTMANVKTTACMCGKNLIYLAYNGDIYPCTYLAGAPNCKDYVIGNIKDETFNLRETWEDPNTYADFRDAERHVCTANRLLEEMARCR